MKYGKVGAFAAVGVLVLAGCNQGGSSSGKGTINFGIELPQQGSELAASQPIINGIKLAVKDAGGEVGGWKIDIPNSVVLDDAKDGVHDPQTGAQNMTALVSNPNVVAVIGPLNSSVAKVQIPLSNAAGLLQCSPANTNEGLTKPEFGALDIRKTNPTKINYVAGWPFVKTDVWKGIEAESGRPIVDPAHKPVIGKRVEFCPSLWGGKDWPSAAYSQKTGLVYVPANENFCGGFTGEKVPLVPGQLWLGTKVEDIGLSVRPGADHFGELQAWDPGTGKKVWSHNFPK